MVNVLNKITTKKDNITTTYKIGDLIEGYYNSSTGKFYEESTYTTEIEGAPGFIYVDLAGNSTYIYKTASSSFVNIAGAGADNIKFGYLNESDGKFYEDAEYTIEIIGDANKIYIDLAEDMIYRYDSANTEFIPIGGGGGGEIYTADFGIEITDDNKIKTTDFVGTQAEWNALSTEEKAKYDFIHITDDTSSVVYKPGHSISDGTTEKTQRDGLVFEGFEVTDDSINEVTKITDIPYTAGDGIEIDDHEVSVTEDRPATFVGTTQEWDALTAAEKAQYKIVNLTNDMVGGETVVVDVVENGNLNPITSNAVYDAIEEINNNLSKNDFGTDVDLSPYTTSGGAYEFPSDGIILVSNQTSTSGVLTVFVLGRLGSSGALISVEGSTNNKYASFPVKKGMKGYILTNTLNNTKTCIFRPYV